MTPKPTFRAAGWCLAVAIFALAGCKGATQPVQFYTLAVPEPAPESLGRESSPDTISLGVGPLEIPKMIDRPQIVTRDEGNKLRLNEFHRWGGSLKEDILRALSERLSSLLRSNRVLAYPWADYFEPDYRIFLVFNRFDGRPGDSLVLNATWTVTGSRGRQALAVKRSVIREPLTATDFESLVAASGRALETLSQQIAREIARIGAR